MMRAYLALTKIDLKLAFRDRSVIFFNYLFPLIFFFAFSGIMGTRGGGMASVVTMVLAIGILGNGLWGAGMRAVQEREMNILRRFKVTPISPAPILVASMFTGWLIYLPAALMVIALAHFMYAMPIPAQWLSLLGLITLGVFAFRSIGLILASIVNSTQESTIAIQILYMPMLFLSGVTIPTTMLPSWAQIIAQFLPATYLVTGLQSVFLRQETLGQNGKAVLALILTMILATFISVQIFRWEKEEKLRPAAKLWVLAVLSPFVVMGCYQAYSNEQKTQSAVLWRELMRSESFLIRNARIFTGNGKVIESGAVLVKDQKIAEIYVGAGPDPEALKVEAVEAVGKTLLPGLIDGRVHLPSPPKERERALAAYLYCCVTEVVDWEGTPGPSGAGGGKLGAEVFPKPPLDSVYAPVLTQTLSLKERGELLTHSLMQQVRPKAPFSYTGEVTEREAASGFEGAANKLLNAYHSGADLVVGSDAGAPLILQGPGIHAELQLWVKAGIPNAVALQAATYNAARLLHADHRIGSIARGYDANLLLADGNPLNDISATERISLVVYKGERLRRGALLEQK